MKNLIILHKDLKHLYTGGQYTLAEIVSHFKQKKINMQVIDCGTLPEKIRKNRLSFIIYFMKFYLKHKKFAFSFVNHGAHFRFLIPFFISRLFGNKYAVSCNQTFYNFQKNVFLKWLEFVCEYVFLHSASLLIFPSKVAVDYFQLFHLEKKNKAIVNPAANVWCEDETTFCNQLRNILFVGQVRWWKGLDILIDALASIKEPKLHLDVVGRYYPDSKYFISIKAQIHKALLNKRITFHGHKSPRELSVLYKHADIFVLPSRYETFGIVLLEAMSFGLPIIASSIPSTKELVKENINGILYDTENPQELTNSILKLMSDRKLRRSIHMHNLQARRRRRTWEMVASEVLTALDKYLQF